MILIESLIHSLIERSLIGVADAVEIVETAVEVSQQIAMDLGDLPATLAKSIAILGTLKASLEIDLPRDWTKGDL